MICKKPNCASEIVLERTLCLRHLVGHRAAQHKYQLRIASINKQKDNETRSDMDTASIESDRPVKKLCTMATPESNHASQHGESVDVEMRETIKRLQEEVATLRANQAMLRCDVTTNQMAFLYHCKILDEQSAGQVPNKPFPSAEERI